MRGKAISDHPLRSCPTSIPIRLQPGPRSKAPSGWSPRPTGSRPRWAWRPLRKAAMPLMPQSRPPSPLQVVEPHLNGPGGDVPVLVFDVRRGRPEVICGQGVAPAAATIAHYRALGLDMVPGTGLLAACVPGTFETWMLLLRDYGTLRACRRARARDRLCGPWPSTGRARERDHRHRGGAVSRSLADIGRGLPAGRRGARARRLVQQQDVWRRPTRASWPRPRAPGAIAWRRSSARAAPGRRALWPRRSTASAAPRR